MSKKNKNEPDIPQIYDVMVAVEAMDKLEKNTSEYNFAKDRAIHEIFKYNEFHGKRGFGTSFSKARRIIQVRNKRLKEEKDKKRLETEFKQAQKSRDYKK